MVSDNLPEHVGLPDLPGRDSSLVAAVNDALMALDTRLPELVGYPEGQVVIHNGLTDLVRNIRIVLDRIEQMLVDELPLRENRLHRMVRDRLVIEGVGTVEPADKNGRWTDIDYPKLLNAVIGIAWANGDVENPMSVAQIVADVVTFSGIRSDSRKGTGLAKYGFDRSDFATYIEGTPGVRIIR